MCSLCASPMHFIDTILRARICVFPELSSPRPIIVNGTTVMEITLRFKVPFLTVLKREFIRLRNNFIIRWWWQDCFGESEPFKVITADQTPFWMNSSAEEGTTAPSGRGGTQVVEDTAASRECFSNFSVDFSYHRDRRPFTGVAFRGKTKRSLQNVRYRPADFDERCAVIIDRNNICINIYEKRRYIRVA